MHNSASSLKTLCTVESAQFYSTFSPTTIRLTWHCLKNAKYSSTFLAEDAQYDPKKPSYEDNAKFHSAFLLTELSYATSFQFFGQRRQEPWAAPAGVLGSAGRSFGQRRQEPWAAPAGVLGSAGRSHQRKRRLRLRLCGGQTPCIRPVQPTD